MKNNESTHAYPPKEKYEILIKILDTIREESRVSGHKRYTPSEAEEDRLNNARARAYIHLFLKVMFGITDFSERERWITDDSYDGGIDAYYIDKETKQIFLIQSKFRTTNKNFETKEIALSEILQMDIDRILDGESHDEEQNEYNGKIKQLQREIGKIDDIARYKYRVVILANLNGVSSQKIRNLTGGYNAEVFDFKKSYEKLVFPVVSGNYFAASEITIPVDISNKSSGTKISYTVTTKANDCEITVLFVPAIEIAKVMSKYKNSILQFNPRSHLELEGQQVNTAIRNTIEKTSTNELALFNNGITIISDETSINEKVGIKYQAQLLIKNPQIINGGQTSYTLSKIYEEQKESGDLTLFDNKEILLKVITLVTNTDIQAKLQLIDEISNATNKQTPVITADKLANDTIHKKIQSVLFEESGLLYERKRGEFADGLHNKYISEQQVIERNLFFRLFYCCKGLIELTTQKRLFQRSELQELNEQDTVVIKRVPNAYKLYEALTYTKRKNTKVSQIQYAKIYIGTLLLGDKKNITEQDLANINKIWNDLESNLKKKYPNFTSKKNKTTSDLSNPLETFSYRNYFRSKFFLLDAKDGVAKFTNKSSPLSK